MPLHLLLPFLRVQRRQGQAWHAVGGWCSKEAGAHLQPRCFGRHVEVPELLEGLLPQEPRRDGGIHLRHRRRAGAGVAQSAAPPPRWRVSAAALPMACTSVTALQPRGPRHGGFGGQIIQAIRACNWAGAYQRKG